MQHKAMSAEVKLSESGHVEAVFSKFNVIDLDRDVTLPGAFTDGAPVRMSAYNHESRRGGMLPVGRGKIEIRGDEAVLVGDFFLKTDHGRNTYETIKGMGDLQEWSYSYDILKRSQGMHGDPPAEVQFLEELKVHEVSPVLLGAGIDTRTLSVKSLTDMTDDELLAEAVSTYKAISERGLHLPPEIVDGVQSAQQAKDALRRRAGTLRLIAAANGIDIIPMEVSR